MVFKNTIPILYSADIRRSLTYYVEVLGFEHRWEWDDPPTFGSVRKDAVELFFCKGDQGNPGTWLYLMVNDINEFYETIKARNANILAAPENMEWGMREMLVKDPDDHVIRFSQNGAVSDREKTTALLPSTVQIIGRAPSAKELHRLAFSVGWASAQDKEKSVLSLSAVAYAVVAEDTLSGEVIGCAFLLGDGEGFYYVRNVIVHRDWQCKRIGSAMMQELTDWLEKHAPDDSFVGLHTGENLTSFYKAFGFVPSFGMFRLIRPKEKDK